MLNKGAHLVSDPFAKDIAKQSTRDGFGTGTVEAGKTNPNIVVLSADLKESTRAQWFEKEFPERFIEVGVAEQNMATVAAGLAAVGKIPFITSYAAFSPGRNYEQIRTTAALNNFPVKVCGMHAGVSVGPDGATHQMLEDISLMRALPNMVVINPTDAVEAHKAVIASALHPGPVYLRFGRSNVPVFTTPLTPFAIGKALVLWDSSLRGSDERRQSGEKPQVSILATGSMAHNALVAARALQSEGIGSIVLSVPTIKPLDEEAVLEVAKKTNRVVTVEEHQVAGGFGGAVAEFLSGAYPVPIVRLGLQNEFGQSGEPDELIAHYKLDAYAIGEAVRRML